MKGAIFTDSVNISPIAYIKTDFKQKFGIPRQSCKVDGLIGKIIFLPPFRNPDALREIEGFSHLWLIFDFSKSHRKNWSATVRPPRLGGNRHIGVFASRSPFRPNPIGLSCVKLIKKETTSNDGVILIVEGADLLDETPIFDIKPYIPFTDCHTDAIGGYSEDFKNYRLKVNFPDILLKKLSIEKRDVIINCLAEDPRPSYQNDSERIYKMCFAEYEIHFNVFENEIFVKEVLKK